MPVDILSLYDLHNTLFMMHQNIGIFIFLSYYKMAAKCPDPVLSQLSPIRHVGAVPELLADRVSQFTDCDPRFHPTDDSDEAR